MLDDLNKQQAHFKAIVGYPLIQKFESNLSLKDQLCSLKVKFFLSR